MRILARSLVVLPAFLAGVVAWLFIPFQPERSVSVPAGTKLLEFSPAGQYVVTFQRDEGLLTLWRTDTAEATYKAEIPYVVPSNVSTNGARAFYGFSADDRWLAIATGAPDEPRLVIVNLISGNASTPITELPPNPDKYRPRPAFSSDGRYLSYFGEDDHGEKCAVLYDLVEEQEQLRVPDISDSLGPPTRQGKWLVKRDNEIEVWDLAQRRRQFVLPPWSQDWYMISDSLAPDEQTVTALCFAERRFFPNEHIVSYRCDLTTLRIEKEWEYMLPSSAQLLWNMASSDPNEFLLIKTLDEDGVLVQDLLDVNTGRVLVRYSPPIDMLENIVLSYSLQTAHHGPGLTHSLGRTGEMAIDSERRIIVSKQISRPKFSWQYYLNNIALRWLGITIYARPTLCLQFHSAETGRLLQHVPLQTPNLLLAAPTLALHPSQPLLAVIDNDGSNSRLQFWRVPPPRPWDLIAACSLAAGGFAWLVWIGYSRIRKRKSQAIIEPESSPGSLTTATPVG